MENKDQDLSFEDVLSIIRYNVKLFFSYKYLVLSVVFSLGSISAYYAYAKETIYVGETSFMLDQQGGSGMSSIMGMASSFGFGGGSSSGVTAEKYVGIITSDKILRNTLLTKRNGKYILESYIIDIARYEDPSFLEDFNFKNTGFVEDSIINGVIGDFRELIGTNISDEGIVTLTVLSIDEQFSFNVVKILLKEVNSFFETNAVQKEQFVFDQLNKRMDSISTQLEYTEVAFAKVKDKNLSVLKATDRVEELRLMRKVEVLGIMYKEIVKKVELARFNLLNKTAMIQVIDSPVLPIEKQTKSWKHYFVYGAFLGGILSIVFILIYDKIKAIDASKDDE